MSFYELFLFCGKRLNSCPVQPRRFSLKKNSDQIQIWWKRIKYRGTRKVQNGSCTTSISCKSKFNALYSNIFNTRIPSKNALGSGPHPLLSLSVFKQHPDEDLSTFWAKQANALPISFPISTYCLDSPLTCSNSATHSHYIFKNIRKFPQGVQVLLWKSEHLAKQENAVNIHWEI